MKYDMNQPLVNYNGQLFTRPVIVDGQPVIEGGKAKQEPLTLRNVLESACLNADPQQYNTGTQKMVVFNVLMKVHKADPIADLTAEDVAILKDLVGKQVTVAAVGVVYDALEKPITE
jgi:hypothetical protein